MVLVQDDGSTEFAYRTVAGNWIVKNDGGGPIDPDPGGEGGWQHPLGKDFPPGQWGSYEDNGGSHSGGAVDFPLGHGTEAQLYAPCDGVVIRSGWEDQWGGNVIIIKPNGEDTGVCMAHLNRMDVAEGATVKGGDKIGLTGWTGYVIPPGPAGAHLHLEVRMYGNQWGPWFRSVPYFAERGVTL